MSVKSESSVRSSDLEVAGKASARLVAAREASRAASAGRAGVVVPPPARWASLAARSPRAAPAEPDPVPEPGIDLAAIEAAGDRGWNVWLAWACEAAPADIAFVVDRHGLAIASHGDVPEDDREAIATRLVMALEQAALLDEGAPGREPSVSIDWRGRTWTATQRAGLVLCLVSLDPIPRARVAHVATAIGRAAAGLSG